MGREGWGLGHINGSLRYSALADEDAVFEPLGQCLSHELNQMLMYVCERIFVNY